MCVCLYIYIYNHRALQKICTGGDSPFLTTEKAGSEKLNEWSQTWVEPRLPALTHVRCFHVLWFSPLVGFWIFLATLFTGSLTRD